MSIGLVWLFVRLIATILFLVTTLISLVGDFSVSIRLGFQMYTMREITASPTITRVNAPRIDRTN